MKMVPPYILDPKTPSSEAKIFKLLEEATIAGVALHSLNIKPANGDGEADFVLVTTFGVLVLEVKGGRIAQTGGHWTTTDRYGRQEALKRSPFRQAKDAAYQIADDLRERTSSRFKYGHGVVLPDSGPIPSSCEYDDAQVASIEHCRTARKFTKWLFNLCDHWSSRLRGCDITADDIDRLVTALRPSFDAAVPIGRIAVESNREIKRFSEEQLETLDAAAGNPRLLCTGGAGTGKTFLLIELAKREAARGKRVVVCAWSAPLRNHIKGSISGIAWNYEPVIACPDSLGSLDPHCADTVLIDEGQDLLQVPTIIGLDRILSGGLEEGSWRWFMDDQNQAGYRPCDEDALELLMCGAPTTFRLSRNCRNTRSIVNFTQLLTGADIGRTQVSGQGIQSETFYSDGQAAVQVIKNKVREWLRDPNVGGSDIAILTNNLADIAGLGSLDPNGIRLSTIQDFKGLESDFAVVLITGTHDLIEGAIRRDIYTAITRARVGVALVLPKSMKTAVERAALQNHTKIERHGQ